ncbi:hypothetical protein [Thaumasiovibrio subtropicus]|uniref:hypothetical protein n=1 Tax=Thaumasiovibrio subtropicus TaxID=1891207 RepID=UPI000B34FD00|nr:hypothetical protein [Thaumasiovibrio subtropicus]
MFLKGMASKFVDAVKENLDFQQRMWVVNIRESAIKNECFLLNEDGFTKPMGWMVDKGCYDQQQIEQLDALRRSESITFRIAEVEHSFVRVK